MAKEKKNNKSKIIKRKGESIVVKKCSCCGESFEQYNQNQSYCPECKSILYKAWTKERKQPKIYYFKPIISSFEGELLNIGSTENIESRISSHICKHSIASQNIGNRLYDIYYSVVEDVSRTELYFIEYYLIDKYKATFGIKPIGNGTDTFNAESIPTSRQAELMDIADELEFSNKYNVLRHRIKKIEMENSLKLKS